MGKGGYTICKNILPCRISCNRLCCVLLVAFACFAALPTDSGAVNHPTSNPYETRPSPDGNLAYQIIPVPDVVLIERDVMVAMPDGVKLACNVYRPNKPGKFPVIVGVTPYGKDQTPAAYNPDGTHLPTTYANYVDRLYAHGDDMGHQKISMPTAFEYADPAFWVPSPAGDRGGTFKLTFTSRFRMIERDYELSHIARQLQHGYNLLNLRQTENQQ